MSRVIGHDRECAETSLPLVVIKTLTMLAEATCPCLDLWLLMFLPVTFVL
jgi:hypothetical protein